MSSTSFLLLLLGCGLPLSTKATPPKYFNIGLMFPISTITNEPSSGTKFMAAMEMAIDEINNKSDGILDTFLPFTELRMVVRSPIETFGAGATDAINMLGVDNHIGVIACVGPSDLASMKGSNPVFSESGNIPQIGYKERASELGDSRSYSNHLRTIPAYYIDGIVIVDVIIDFFGWNKVTLFSTTDDYGSKASFLFQVEAAKRGIDILSAHAFLVDTQDLSTEINAAKKQGASIFVFLMHATDALTLMKQGFAMGLFDKNTQIIGGDRISEAVDWDSEGLSDNKVGKYLSGFIGTYWKPKVFPSDQVTDFIRRWKSRPSTAGTLQPDNSVVCDDRSDYYNSFKLHEFQPYGNASVAPVCAGVNFSSYSDDGSDLLEEMFAYDAVMAVARSLHHIAYEEGVCDPTPAHVLNNLLYDLYFEGLTGNVSFSTTYEKQFLDVGGRASSYVYEVVNYRPGSSSSDGSGSVLFQPVVEWHSEQKFAGCNGHQSYSSDCHDVLFATKDNSKPFDSPPPRDIEMYSHYRALLVVFASGCLVMVLVFVTVILTFKSRRIVRMAQPYMITLACIGILMMCVRVILAAVHLTFATCTGEFWMAHLGFIVVMSSFGVKTWRVHMVTNSMKKVNISEAKCLAIVGVIVFLSSILMAIHTAIGHIQVAEVTIVQDQFEYVRELKCADDNKDALYALNAVEIILILFTARMLWLTRKVASTISSTVTTATAVVNICVSIVAMYLILAIVVFEPQVRQFFIGLVIIFLSIRVTWILYSALVFNVLLGYDLDKALQMKKMAWSIANVGLFKSAAKVLGHGDAEMSTVSGTASMSHGSDDAAYTKAMAKFSKSKNAGDLQYEIDKIKKEISDRQSELACLENMKFASDHSNNSSSRKNSSSHHEEPPPPSSQDGGRGGVGHIMSVRKTDANHVQKIETSSGRQIGADIEECV